MNIIGKKVKHLSMGEGVVKKCDDEYVTIQINSQDKAFSYPLSFDRYLKFENTDCQKYVEGLIKDVKAENERVAEAERISREEELAERISQAEVRKKSRKGVKKAVSSGNIAFKCTYCDGGSNEKQVGFNGVCSDKTMKYNIKTKKHKWCTDPECKCSQYFNEEIDKKELSDQLANGDFLCYESVMLQNWEARGGERRKGDKKGQAFAIKGAKKNGLIILTTRLPYGKEIDRIIFAVYIADEVVTGDNFHDAIVTAHEKYRIELTKDESEKMLFWKYYHNSNSSDKAFWGTGLFRYVENDAAYHLLNDIINIKTSEKDKELVQEMLDFYCEKNNVKTDKISELKGLIK